MLTPGGRPADTRGFGKPGSSRGLTDEIRAVVHALRRKHPDWTLSHAIAVARSQAGKWARNGKTAAVRTGYAATLAEQSVLDHRKRDKRMSNEEPTIVSAQDGPAIAKRLAAKTAVKRATAKKAIAR